MGVSSDSSLRAYQDPRSRIIFLIITSVLLSADLLVKHLAFANVADSAVVLTHVNARPKETIPPHEPISVVPYILSLKLTTNPGAVFGLGKGGKWLFVTVSIVAVAVIIHVYWHSPAKRLVFHVALAMVLAGALGNLYDRIRFSAVRDMFWLFPSLKLPFGLTWFGGADGLYPWIFNLADAALVIGVGLLVVVTWRTKPDQQPGQASRAR